jgi:hypothetical protein
LNTTKAPLREITFIRDEFQEGYNQFKLERDIFMAQVVSYQEETLLGLIAHKDMMRWSERSHKDLAQIEYIREIQKGWVKRSMASGCLQMIA